ncbi:hypothetical protein LCGC14_2971450, partial [marine sediment metagenome]
MVMVRSAIAKKVVATVIVATDGSGDYTDIQDGIDALPSGGGVVYIKEGTYDIDTTITIPNSNISVIGAGHSTIIQTSGNIDVISTTSESNLVIEDIFINGAGTGNASNNGINFDGISDSTIEG